MKKFCSFFALLLCLQATSQTTLKPGDVAIIAARTNSSYKQSIVFVALRNIPTGTVLTFTDVAWISGQQFNATPAHPLDGGFRWQAPSQGVQAGEAVTIEITIDNATGVSSNVVALNNRGNCSIVKPFFLQNPDQILVFQGSNLNNPYPMLWAYNIGTIWDYVALDPSTTCDMPLALNPANGEDYHVAVGKPNATFFNAKSGRVYSDNEELIMFGWPKSFVKVFNNKDLYQNLSYHNSLSFPEYQFTVLNTTQVLPPTGELIQQWGFQHTLIGSPQANVVLRTKDGTDNQPNIRFSYGGGLSNRSLRLDSFPAYTNFGNLAGIEFEVSTQDFEDMTLSFDITMDARAANTIITEYSLNEGEDWVPIESNLNNVSLHTADTNYYPVMEYFIMLEDDEHVYRNPYRAKFALPNLAPTTGKMTIRATLPDEVEDRNKILFRIVTMADPLINFGEYKPTNIYSFYDRNAAILLDNLQVWGIRRVSTNDKKQTTINNSFKISPSLATGGSIIATHEKAQKGAFISVTDAQTGRKLLTQAIAEGSTQTTVPIGNLVKGHLIAEFINGNTKASAQFVKQ